MTRIVASWRLLIVAVVTAVVATAPVRTANAQQYTADQLVSAGETFFGQVAGNVASVIEHAVAERGLPNGYILGETIGGAFILGARFGEGTLYTQNLGSYPVYWRGPSIGFDIGADASKTMMLVYNLPSVEALFQRFPGVSGSAYVVGGVGMTVLARDGIILVPIVSGLGARVGINISYLNFSRESGVLPF